ncbi:tryptophan transporter [Bacillus sp. CGMCC 1.16541]|uniref:tryptophan transporter n=1 Tax=Bacillus sp. CGMCC 1.16541 TaxID=2185143 RepID=UPI000D73AB5A|nr:tryptophan transporter [Bacillus sp. CGMCC 1.16541]
MNTKVLVSLSLLVGIGAVLHTIVPPILFGMKPDMLLTMMFLGIMLFPSVKNIVLLGITTGVISALTTGFPGGQIANMIDKPISAFLFLGLFLVVRKTFRSSTVSAAALTAIGTVISGVIFLSAAYFIIGLPGGFLSLVAGVVLPTAVVNTIVMVVVYPIVQNVLKRTKIASEVA